MPVKQRRVLLKLSGEAFGAGALGVDPDVVARLAREIAAATEQAEIAIVVGGGNFAALSFRHAGWIGRAPTIWACSELL